MSDLITLARDILAVCSPVTGARASGTVTITAEDADVNIPIASYALPNINGQLATNLPFKVDEGPNDDESWTVTSEGTAVNLLSNIGGERHNVAAGTEFVFDPPISGVDSIIANDAFTGGAPPTGLTALADAVMWESLESPFNESLADSGISGFPAALIAWQNGAPADGSTDGYTSGSRTSRTSQMFRDVYGLSVISGKSNSGHHRRQQGLAIVSDLCNLMIDRHSVDGKPFSNPRGIQIISRYRERPNNQTYKRFFVYTIMLGVMHNIEQTDARAWNDYLHNNIDVLTMQRPPLPNQGDFVTVDDMEVDMPHD